LSYAEQALAVLKARGYRITRPRRRVLELLQGAEGALSIQEIKELLDRAEEPVDMVSVYRIVDCLEDNALVHRVLSTGKIRRCDLENEAHCHREQHDHCHHNLICRECGSITELHCPGLDTLQDEVARQTGFHIEEHNLEFLGLCPRCAAREGDFRA